MPPLLVTSCDVTHTHTNTRARTVLSGRLAACRQGFPRCTRDTSTQTLKILGSWMYALAYVNCDSFSFPFLVGAARPGARDRDRDPAAARVYIFLRIDYMICISIATYNRRPARRYVVLSHAEVCTVHLYETGEDIDRSTLTSPITTTKFY